MSIYLLLIVCILRLFRVLYMAQPLSLGITILFIALVFSLIRAIEVSTWYRYILYLIYVGGIIVMFAYVMALIPNILFEFSSYLTKPLLAVVCSILMVKRRFTMDLSVLGLSLISSNYKGSGSSLCSLEILGIFISLAIILFIVLVVVVKICFTSSRSLRPFKYAFFLT